jgi:hypothetical protein
MEQRKCSVNGCGEPHSARGYCAVHYQHWYRYGDPLYYAPPGKKDCDFKGCTGTHDSNGYCSAHAKQLARGEELHLLRPMWRGAPCTATEDCGEPIIARGYCRKHWAAWRKYGDPLGHAPVHREYNRPPAHRERRRGTYALDEAYFDEITTEVQAYWLGFLAADGSVIRSGTKTYSLRVELAERDRGQLERLCDSLGSDRPLYAHLRKGTAVATFDSWRLVESLERLGITPRKSATVLPWDGPDHLMPHYWRGLFDGDGSIYRVRTDWCLNLIGSRACIDAFSAWARVLSRATAQPRAAKGGMWTWAVTGSRKPQLLARTLYRDAPVALARKLALAEDLCAMDFDAQRLEANARRAASMRDAWQTGRHARSRKAR